MSLAWGSLVLLVLLLPGVLFFVGFYLPEQFTRETAERSALGQLAATLLESFGVHGALYALSPHVCGTVVPCMSLESLFRVVNLNGSSRTDASAVARELEAYRWWIFGYVMSTAAAGVLAGFAVGKLVVTGFLRRLAQHTWIYDLSVGDNFTVAYVLTHVRQDDRILMYQGFLKSFALRRDGKFSYIVLTDARRGYMHLGEVPTTSQRDAWKSIGGSGLSISASFERNYKRRDRSYFIIEGEDIANAVFDRLAFDYTAAAKDMVALVKRLRSELLTTRPTAPGADTTEPPRETGSLSRGPAPT